MKKLLLFLTLSLTIMFSFSACGTAATGSIKKMVIENILPEKASFTTIPINGKIYAFKKGLGYDAANDKDYSAAGKVYVYDPSFNTWEKKQDMPVKKISYAVVAFNDKIYTIGGMTAPDTPTNSVEEYDPVKDTWAVRKNMPTARFNIGTVILNDNIYVLGGRMQDMETDAVEAYDPVKDTWANKANLPQKMMAVVAATVNNEIFLISGANIVSGGNWDYQYNIAAYNAANDTWTKKADWWYEREPEEAIVVSNRLFVIGGGAFTRPDVRSVKEYDQIADDWIFRCDMPAQSMHTIHFNWVVYGGKIYTFGGGYWNWADETWVFSRNVQRYDPLTDTWEELEPLSEGKYEIGIAVVDNKIILFGGEKVVSPGENPYSHRIEIYEIRK